MADAQLRLDRDAQPIYRAPVEREQGQLFLPPDAAPEVPAGQVGLF